MTNRGWWIAVLLLLVAMGTALVSSAQLENQTWDEGIHLAAGYSYLSIWDYRLNWEHPPLGKMLAALPLLPLDARLPTDYETWRTGDTVRFGGVFVYRNRLPPDQLLFLGRLPTIVMTLLLGFIFAWWTKRNFGPAVAAVAVFLYALDPNVTAHGRYVTTDLIATLTVFVSVITWVRYLRTKQWLDLLWASLALGVALASKFSTVFLFILLPALYLARRWQAPRQYSLRRLAVSMVLLVFLSVTVMLVSYLKESRKTLIEGDAAPITAYTNRDTLIGDMMHRMGEKWDLPAHPYLKGLNLVAQHNHSGHPTYLLGKTAGKGTWYYFPVAFGVKTTTAVLLLLSVGLGGWFWSRRAGGGVTKLRELPFQWLAVTIVPAGYLAFCMSSNLNLGVRHILPIYPFLFILAAAVLVKKPAWPLVMLVLGLQVYEYTRVAPHFLAFFNTLVGGPENGPSYLLDSNLDWGQDIKKLAKYRDEHGIETLYLHYFGAIDVEYHLGPHEMLANHWKGNPADLDGLAAISATVLQGVYGDPEQYKWFRDREPDARIGYSIYVYDMRREK